MNESPTPIERTSFGRVAHDLDRPRSPIHFLVYVRHRDLLTEVANWVKLELLSGYKPGPYLTPAVQGLASREIVKLSSRHPLRDFPQDALVDPKSLNQFALCDVIRLPPYCLVYTPVLFQQKIKANLSSQWDYARAANDRDYGHGH
jgi:hypothetical protein